MNKDTSRTPRTDAMDKEREALVARLRELEDLRDDEGFHVVPYYRNDLRQAIAALTAPQQEPVAWMYQERGGKPFASMNPPSSFDKNELSENEVTVRPLVYGYTAPPSGVREGMLRAAEIAKDGAKYYDDLAKKGESRTARTCAADIAKGYRGAEYAIARAAETINAEGLCVLRDGLMHTECPTCKNDIFSNKCPLNAPTPQPADGVVVPSKMTLMNAAFALECPEEVPKEKRMAIAQKLLAAAKHDALVKRLREPTQEMQLQSRPAAR